MKRKTFVTIITVIIIIIVMICNAITIYNCVKSKDRLEQLNTNIKNEENISQNDENIVTINAVDLTNMVVTYKRITPSISTNDTETLAVNRHGNREVTQSEENVVNETQGETKVEKTTTNEVVKEKPTINQNELNMLAHLIYAEAGGCNRQHQLFVGSVVLNRVKDSRFPNTIKDVIFQKNQYSCTWNGAYEKDPSSMSLEVAESLLRNGSVLPDYVVFQAEFKQGKGLYAQLGNTYFCY